MVAAAVPAHTDDVPGDLADHVCGLAGRLLDWTCQQLQPGAATADDAPFTRPILDLDTDILNAFAERPALRHRVRKWVAGMPAALLSLQSVTLELSRLDRDHSEEDASAVRSIFSRMPSC